MAYKMLSESAKTMDDFLRHVLVKEGVDELRFRKLDEAQKKEITNTMVDALVKSVKERISDLDYKVVEASKGDVTKIQGYADLEGSIKLLQAMRSKDPNSPEEIFMVHDCLQNLIANKAGFEEGFRQGNELIEILYSNVVIALIKSTSLLIAATVSYVRDSMGQYMPKFEEKKANFKDADLFLANVKKFNSFARSGKLRSYFDATNGSKNAVGTIALGAVTAIAVVAFVIWMIREIVYAYYYTRGNMSSYLKQLSDFVQMNASTLEGKDMKKTRERQEAVAKRLAEFSEKVKVENKVGNKKAAEQLQKENDQADFSSVSAEGNFL